MKSIIPWIGGKSQLCSTIRTYFPKKEPGRYIEAFGGGGSLLFSSDKHAPFEVFNDRNGQLINLYRCIKYHPQELRRELLEVQWLPVSRELFFDWKGQMEVSGFTDIQRAARYFYIIRTSFGADGKSFICKDTSGTVANAIDRFPEVAERLRSVVIENQDFERLIKTYDRPDALLYLDPPYYDAEQYYDGFAGEDHRRLLRCLQKVKGKFILSYNDHPAVREMYRDFHIFGVDRNLPITNKREDTKRTYKELIILNYEPETE